MPNPYGTPGFPMFNNPPINPQMPLQPSGQSLIKVSGIDGAKAFQMAPNSSVALFHESEDILYVKTTDGAGFPTIRTFKFEPLEDDPKSAQYVTVDEFNRFKEEVYAKQSVRTKKSTADSPVE